MENVTKKEATFYETATLHGYARCSTNGDKQDINRQIRELKAAGATRLWYEYEHGDAETKEQQALMLQETKPGDTVIVCEVSRLCRSTQQFCALINEIKAKKLRLQIINSITFDARGGDENLDPLTVCMLQMCAIFSELELQLIRSRVRSGMKNAKAKGVKLGRPTLTSETIPDTAYRYLQMLETGTINITEMSKLLNVSRPTIYRWLKVMKT